MRLFLSTLLFFLLAATSVSAQDELPTIADIVASDDRLTTLNTLLDHSDELRAFLDKPDGAFTLFAPTDGNWSYFYPEGDRVDFMPLLDDPEGAATLLRYYTLPVIIEDFATPATDNFSGGYLAVDYGTMLPGYTILAFSSEESVRFNNAQVSETIEAANGVIAVLEQVMPLTFVRVGIGREMLWRLEDLPTDITLPDTDETVVDVLMEVGEFSTVLRLLDAFPDIATQIENGGLYTLIVPTDSAFLASGYTDDVIDQMIADTEYQWGRIRLQEMILAGYYTVDALRALDIGSGFRLQLATVGDYPLLYTMYDPVTNTTDGVIRLGGIPINEDALLARNAIIYRQDETYPRG
jgi:uncharacterized surface protein with fasciclin (FAS1) repeats